MEIEMTRFELGWVVGILEGEGWFGVRNGRPEMSVVMTDQDAVRRLADRTEVGNVTGPHQHAIADRKPYWRWSVSARDDAAWLMKLVLPYMSTRRQGRIVDILDEYELAGPTKGTAPTCRRGHDVSPGSPNLRLITDSKGYVRRRCLACCAIRQLGYRGGKK